VLHLIGELAAESSFDVLLVLLLVYGFRIRYSRSARGEMNVDVQLGSRKHDGKSVLRG
jgi:hypothetical protein